NNRDKGRTTLEEVDILIVDLSLPVSGGKVDRPGQEIDCAAEVPLLDGLPCLHFQAHITQRRKGVKDKASIAEANLLRLEGLRLQCQFCLQSVLLGHARSSCIL